MGAKRDKEHYLKMLEDENLTVNTRLAARAIAVIRSDHGETVDMDAVHRYLIKEYPDGHIASEQVLYLAGLADPFLPDDLKVAVGVGRLYGLD